MKKKLINGFLVIAVMMAFLATQNTVAYAEGGAASTYTVAAGDCLYSIARSVLGDEKRWNELYDLNKDSIKNPSLIHVGQVLTLPGAAVSQGEDVTASTAEQTEQSTEAISDQAAAEAPAATAQDEESAAQELAKAYIAKAKVAEPTVTGLLQEMESDTVKLVGLEFDIKSEESLTRKILTDSHELEISLDEAAAAIGDVLRYTLCTNTDNYVETVDSTIKKLTAEGIKVVVFKNTWGSDSYKGINTRMQTTDGVIFELQFHTQESYDAKMVGHEYYEIVRSENATQAEKDEAEAKSNELFAKIPIPEGAPEYQWK